MNEGQTTISKGPRSLLGIYAFSVCFISIVGVVVCIAIGVISIVHLIAPDRSIYNYEQFENNDDYFTQNRYAFTPPKTDPASTSTNVPVRPSEDELTKKRKEGLVRQIRMIERQNQNSLIDIAIWLAVLVPTFLLHWRIAKRNQVRAS